MSANSVKAAAWTSVESAKPKPKVGFITLIL